MQRDGTQFMRAFTVAVLNSQCLVDLYGTNPLVHRRFHISDISNNVLLELTEEKLGDYNRLK